MIGSGNGTHLYWRLAEPYLIDDVGPPPKVEKAFVEKDGKKTVRQFVTIDGERLYLDQHPELKRLSENAHHVQNVLAGIAEAIGGDHTYDLARLLRVPGTLNRKDQRNGKAPKPTSVHAIDHERRYAFSDFERFAKPTKEAERERKISEMPLPESRKLTPKGRDSLHERLALCRLAEPGSRSEADFAACCYAVRKGIDPEAFWSEAAAIGKFAEAGPAYFERTWEAAERTAREETLQRLEGKTQSTRTATPKVHDDRDETALRPQIRISSEFELATTLRSLSDVLVGTKSCFSRAGQLVDVRGDEIRTILSAPELSGLVSQYAECVYGSDDAQSYRPLSTPYANAWLNNALERERFPRIKLFTRNPVFAGDDWRLTPSGFDAETGVYYAGPPIDARDDTQYLDALLRDFCFKDDGSRANYVGMLLTILLMPRFIGSKPGILFNGNQPGLGKTMLAQIIARRRDGGEAETLTYNPNDEEFEKSFGAVLRNGATTLIVDNAKTNGRNSRIDSPCLERLITAMILSVRLLGHSLTIKMENSHIFCITANAPDVSRDLITRCIVANLYHEGDPAKRDFEILDIEEHALQFRTAILGELIGMVERWKTAGQPLAKTASRFNKKGWGDVVGGILQHAGISGFLANAQDAATELDDTRRELEGLVELMADNDRGTWTSLELVDLAAEHQLLVDELGTKSKHSRSTRMGFVAARFDKVPFQLSDGRVATLLRKDSRKGKVFVVDVADGEAAS